jgi:hypothetical protein
MLKLVRDTLLEEKMRCDKCDCPIEKGEEAKHLGQMLCEDCYIDALSPVKACDPWAVYTAKSMDSEGAALTELQERILNILGETNGIEPNALAKRLDLKLIDLEREIATLRHMEKLRAKMKGDKKVICLW